MIVMQNKAVHIRIVFPDSRDLCEYCEVSSFTINVGSTAVAFRELNRPRTCSVSKAQPILLRWQVYKRRQVYAREMNGTSANVQFREATFNAQYFCIAHKARDLWQQVLASCWMPAASKPLCSLMVST